MIRAVVGSGGKTTLIQQWAREYTAMGKKVFVTTSTHMYREEDTLATGDAREIIRVLEEKGYVMAGLPGKIPENEPDVGGLPGNGEKREKIRPLPLSVYYEVCRHADVVLVEADGSRQMPIKFPDVQEPVIYDNIEEIVVVCGLWALRKKAGDAAHRLELVKRCLGITEDTPIEAAHIQKLIQKGYVEPLREKFPEKEIKIKPSHGSSLYQRAAAALLEAEKDVSLIREEWFEPQPRLIICGGGHISCDLVKMAACLGFRIRVIDDREEFANEDRFPLADEVICDSFERLERYLDPQGYYVVVTRGHEADYACIKTILGHPFRYLGMIGSKKKVETTFERLRKESVSEEQIRSIHAPIGLPIKAVTPAEIAVSILAEIILEKNARQTGSVSEELLAVREKGTLCVITGKTGSTPRGVGTMMFVGESEVVGTVGGGAIEYAAIREARGGLGVRERTYDLSGETGKELGMVCGGSSRILFIPL